MGANVIHFPHATATCASCPWTHVCAAPTALADRSSGHAGDIPGADEEALAQRCSVPTRRGQHVYRQGEAQDYLYVLRSGSARSYLDSSDGLEQTVAFHFPGDLLGFDAFGDGRYETSVVALETAALCRMPVDRGTGGLFASPAATASMTRAAAQQMNDRARHALMLGQKTALARFAGFLLDLSRRYGELGCSRHEFNLSMSRQDIANYLALAVETVSRLFGELQQAGTIAVDRRNVRILSLDDLAACAGERAPDDARRTSL